MTDKDSLEEEIENKALKQDIQTIKCILEIFERVLGRTRRIDDPVLKNALLVDKLSLCLDTSIGMLKGFFFGRKNFPEDLMDRIDKLSDQVSQDLNGLMDWIRSPHYSPDHPFGNKVMKDIETQYNEKASLNDSE